MTPTSRRPWIALALLASFPARAERFDSAQDFASSGGRFQAVPDASSLMTDLQPHLSARTRFFFHEGYDPLRSPLSEGLDAFEAQLHLEGTIALFNHFLVGFDLPTQYTRPTGFALRDATFRLAGRFVGGQGDPLAVGIDGWAFLPSGSPEQKSGDTQARGFVRLVVSGDTPRLSYAGNVGYYHRGHEVIASDYEIGPSLLFGMAAGVNLGKDRLYLGPEVWGMTMLPQESSGTGLWSVKSTPIEGLITVKYRIGTMILSAGAGRGLTSTPGTSSFSSNFAVTFITDPFRADDDGDKIVNAEDACYTLPGQESEEPARNGCPDQDQDSFLDPFDACPTLAGADHPDLARLGCPDRDQDGEIDTIDACPDTPGPARTDVRNGCPIEPDAAVQQPWVLTPIAPTEVERAQRPRFKTTHVESFDLGFGLVADLHVQLLAVQRRFEAAVLGLQQATGAPEGTPLEEALASFRARHGGQIVLVGNFQSVPPRIGAIALPGAPEDIAALAQAMDAALQEVLAVSTEAFRIHVQMTALYAGSTALLTEQVPERRKLARQGLRGVGQAILLGDRTRANIELAQDTLHLFEAVVAEQVRVGGVIVAGLGEIWQPTAEAPPAPQEAPPPAP